MVGRPRRYDDGQILEAWQRLLNGRLVARELGIPPKVLYRYLNRLGVAPGKGQGAKRPRVHRLDLDEVRRLYWDEGLSTVEIGERLGVSAEVVRRQMARAGIARRDLQGSRARGPKNRQWKGGRSKTMHKYRRESYEVAAICLGHPLPPGFVIHHLDENQENNHYHNLVIFPSQSQHLRYHQRQLATPTQADSAETTRAVSENGGRWLPPPPSPIPSEPDTAHLGLSRRPQ